MTLKEAQAHLASRTQDYANSFQPQSIYTYQYWAQIVKVVDADTIDLSLSLGFDIKIKNRTRLMGIDTPEVYGVKHDSEEYKKGLAASMFVKEWSPEGSWVEAKIFYGKKEKYGRWLCEIFKDGASLNVALLVNGHAKPY